MKERLEEIIRLCGVLGCRAESNAALARYTTFKIGGPADLLVTADSEYIGKLWLKCTELGLPVMIMGNGSNMLVSDKGFRGVVICTGDGGVPKIRSDGTVECSAGISLKKLCVFSRNHGLSGLEFAYGIPGTVGGGIYMNAGAYGGQMSDVVTAVMAVYPDGSTRDVPVSEMDMGYRHSTFMDSGAVVISAVLTLKPGVISHISGVMDGVMFRRREKQPLEFPSAGSFFKRPAGYFAGALIEQSGLKGHMVGGAQVSEKHAGFIINRKCATCDDVRRLADEVTHRVFTDHGVTLYPEVQYIG